MISPYLRALWPRSSLCKALHTDGFARHHIAQGRGHVVVGVQDQRPGWLAL
jgi:hypothetical protein